MNDHAPSSTAATPAPPQIKKRERTAILQSLSAGVVPRIGLQHIQVGRKLEVEAVLGDLSAVQDGSAAFRLIIGPFGSGKTFFVHLAKTMAFERRFVVATADLTPERRLSGSSGVAVSLYQELMRSVATKTSPEGGALGAIVERWITDQHLTTATPEQITAKLRPLHDHVGGFDFATVVGIYAAAVNAGDDDRRTAALRWLRGEFSTKTEARQALGVRDIVSDANWYDHIKLLASFARMAGYAGLLVAFDEAINLYKLRHPDARSRNYEQILRILNDCLQGVASGLMVLVGGTPEFLRDTRRGLFSYAALRTRLTDNVFATAQRRDLSGPVIDLPALTIEDLVVLLRNIRRVHAGGKPEAYLLPDEAITAFINRVHTTLGADCFRTPRDSVVQFIRLLSLLDQHPGMDWKEPLQGAVQGAVQDTATTLAQVQQDEQPGDDLASFKL